MPNNTDFKLLYQASRDGFGASDFHSKCNGIFGTFTLIKSMDSYIFGGYTGADWSGYTFKNDSNAFVFSLINPFNVSFRSNVIQPQSAINANEYYGPSFGFDLLIMDQSNTTSSSYFNLQSYYYQTPSFFKDLINQPDYSAKYRYYSFQTFEIEVYSLNRKYIIYISFSIYQFIDLLFY
jgi:hypothetical protein